MVLKRRYYKGEPTDHFDGGRFFLPDKPFSYRYRDILKWRMGPRNRWPKKVIEKRILPETEPRVEGKMRVTYIGHATILIQADNLNILTDPQFSLRAGPLFGPKRIQPPGLKLRELPHIDVIFISHNHYDHLDLSSIRAICKRDDPLIITPLGNDKIISRVRKAKKILTLDWYETFNISSHVSIQLLPCQHWSARTLFDRNKALWGSACFTFENSTFLFVSDTGFDEEMFSKLSTTIGVEPDIIALPIGCYSPRWVMSYCHMNPEEAWESFKILRGKKFLPIHYDVFPLADEPFGEALQRLRKAAGKSWHQILPLRVGEYAELCIEDKQ